MPRRVGPEAMNCRKTSSLLGRLTVAALLGALTVASTASRGAELTPTETRWLKAAWPVIDYAKRAGMPLDIVVQPQDTPGLAPLSMAYVGDRCKLVLSMRGNPEAQATLQRLDAGDPALVDATLELMAAHELGHCHRYLAGEWFALPAGFVEHSGAHDQRAGSSDAAARREEGYGDLVGLAWTRARHPALYPRLHAWLVRERETDRVPGGAHDTLAWITLAADAARLDPAASLFEQAFALWAEGTRARPEESSASE